MRIANPIYDAVFKYLMEDTEIAKGLISEIIGEEIVDLELKPQEHFSKKADQILIFRLDFKAIIKTAAGQHKKTLIELQKSKHLSDIVRFRKYLGENYRKEDEVKDENGHISKVSLPIITIYFLGFKLENVTSSALKVNRHYKDILTQEILEVKEDFIEQLTHDSYVIQIPRLQKTTRTKLERILGVFDQTYKTDEDRILEFKMGDIKDELLQKIVDRLIKASANEEVLQQIELEEEMENLIEKHIREKENLKEKLSYKDQALLEKDQALLEKDQALLEKDRLIEELKKKLKNDN